MKKLQIISTLIVGLFINESIIGAYMQKDLLPNDLSLDESDFDDSTTINSSSLNAPKMNYLNRYNGLHSSNLDSSDNENTTKYDTFNPTLEQYKETQKENNLITEQPLIESSNELSINDDLEYKPENKFYTGDDEWKNPTFGDSKKEKTTKIEKSNLHLTDSPPIGKPPQNVQAFILAEICEYRIDFSVFLNLSVCNIKEGLNFLIKTVPVLYFTLDDHYNLKNLKALMWRFLFSCRYFIVALSTNKNGLIDINLSRYTFLAKGAFEARVGILLY